MLGLGGAVMLAYFRAGFFTHFRTKRGLAPTTTATSLTAPVKERPRA